MNLHKPWLKTYHSIKGNRIKFNIENLRPLNKQILWAAVRSLDIEVDHAILDIYSQFYQQPKFLTLSGGLDSEYIAKRLVELKLDFTPLLLRVGNLNGAELSYAFKWCRDNNKTPIVLDSSPEKILHFIKTFGINEYLTPNLGGYVSVFLADYVKNHLNGVVLSGSGDLTISTTTSVTNSYLVEPDPKFASWDLDYALETMRPGQHPPNIFSYYPSTLYSWVEGLDTTLNEQEAKAKLYNVPFRPKIDYFSHPEWHKYLQTLTEYIKFVNFEFGTKQQTLNWIKGIEDDNSN